MRRLTLIAMISGLAGCARLGGETAGVHPQPIAAPPSTKPTPPPRSAVIHGTLRTPGQTGLATAKSKAAVLDAVVFVDRPEPRAPEVQVSHAASSPHPRISLEAHGFLPRVVAISRGDSVDFSNRDRRYHSAFSVSPARKFDLGSIAPGATRSVRFDQAGAVRVFCTLHSDSSAYVFVAANPAFARPDSLGAFSLPALPPGPYRVRAWHPRFGERSWNVELPRRGVALDLRF